ncbi:MAG TPA: PEP-utilizing enzyme [Candidatus Limnocylindrales bacterium]|nr:PEP-utilizing enzyme [Candidatus Limnocylindrales bacterium]
MTAIPEGAPAEEAMTWAEPGFETLTWDIDDMHTPRVLTRLAQEYLIVLADGGRYRARKVGLPTRFLCHIHRGHVYFAAGIDAPADQHESIRAGALAQRRAEFDTIATYWNEHARPSLVASYAEMDGLPAAGATPAELAAAWDRAWEIAARAWGIHFYVISAPYQVLEDLVDFVEKRRPGTEAGAILAMAGGRVDELRRVDEALDDLAATLAGAPEVLARLAQSPAPSFDELRRLTGGEPFVAQVRAFLAEHGHLGHVSEDLQEPSWNADPGPLLADLAARRRRDPAVQAKRQAAREAEAEALERQIRADLADEPADAATFERLLSVARAIGPLTEGHNYWIDRMCGDRLYRFTRRIGAILVATDVLDRPDDITHLHRDEVRELLLEPADRRALISERIAEHAHLATLVPPRTLGAPPPPEREVDRFDGVRVTATEPDTLRGTGASAGTVRAVARVVAGPADFDRVAPGEIVVARASNPGWVPLFGIAGGFVTDTGGVLSHAAVVAREFGLPAVVGSGEATTRITDGQIIEIDGTTGLIRLG